MTPFNVSVLFWSPRLNRPQANPGFLHGEGNGEREFGAVVDLDVPNGEPQRLAHRGQEVQTGAVVFAWIQPQDTIARAVIQGRVLKPVLTGDLPFFDVDLHTVAGVLLAEEDRLACMSWPRPSDGRIAEISANPTDGCRSDPNAMHAIQPDPGPHRPKLQVAAGLFNQSDRLLGQLPATFERMAWDQPGRSAGRPSAMPGPDRLPVQSKSPSRAFEAILLGIASYR